MDQDSFRQLMQTPRVGAGGSSALGAASGSRPKLAVPSKKKAVEPAQPAFKPRKVKKQDSKYRDRATERRLGEGNDYAHVEAVLEDFEKKHADEDEEKIEAQRKYLGGDGDHSILVKGLDFALLEQNKARSVLSKDDVDDLEQAFMESSSHLQQTVPKKRTREEIIQELKSKRAGTGAPKPTGGEDQHLEEARQKGKFKPIGFKPIGSTSVKKKKMTMEVDGEKKKKKKKKRRIDEGEEVANLSMPPPPVPTKAASEPIELGEPADDDFDIFAGAGEYEGVDIEGDDDKSDNEEGALTKSVIDNHDELEDGEEPSALSAPRRWIDNDDQAAHAGTNRAEIRSAPPLPNHEDEDMDDDRPMRLEPLESSALPSIKDLLEMDKAAGSYNKKKKRKDKMIKGDNDTDNDTKKKTVEAKVDRDYQRLKSYTEKKAASGGRPSVK